MSEKLYGHGLVLRHRVDVGTYGEDKPHVSRWTTDHILRALPLCTQDAWNTKVLWWLHPAHDCPDSLQVYPPHHCFALYALEAKGLTSDCWEGGKIRGGRMIFSLHSNSLLTVGVRKGRDMAHAYIMSAQRLLLAVALNTPTLVGALGQPIPAHPCCCICECVTWSRSWVAKPSVVSCMMICPNSQVLQIGNIEVGVNVDVEYHPVGSSTPQNCQIESLVWW